MTVQSTAPSGLGTSLVIGGCGFVGYYIVKHLLEDREFGAVYVLDCKPDHNLLDKATYIEGDVRDVVGLRALVDKLQPSVIFNTASPRASLPFYRFSEFIATNIDGTKTVIDIATESDSVKALVYTSTIDVYATPPLFNVAETHPLWPESDKSDQYNRTKAIGDLLVQKASNPRLRTAVLRLAHVYGERQSQGLDEVLNMCSGNKKLVQIGQGENVMEVVSADNGALGHLLTAKALLDPSRASGKVDGEAFNISDGAPVPFWYHNRLIWEVVRGKDALKDVMIIPAWVMIVMVNVVEWLLWIFTLNIVKPPIELRRVSLHYCIDNNTFNSEKARERLRFQPVVDHDAVVAQGVRWALAHRAKLLKEGLKKA
ncbi:Sterol-4-alpha-carboxylate 3-dehydrogenase erg26-like protein [Cladobotryum mycophilum]|uniref:Sterol-4-alpha-carboxylate 3-dehydrogenase erg26-like protein n=1 Tax=Cladobotryum mycophilum TaxID=491253 RepID=A0ABR0SN39_9HYPO